ncbi:hypothetical protein ElyMa_006598500 [Elysia marginata]|uniref:Uncharacterized protein n=1 Tax=Elysia marginata TaxID=1093978 RepID=A0AAV4IDV5_9GAST|nr:hypothetical protein ElyMa_006598500 [Elysia marginata]
MEEKAKNLGVIFDSDFSTQHQVSSLCKSLHFQLRKNRQRRRIPNRKSGKDSRDIPNGPVTWNKIPMSVKQSPTLEIFKRRLKTFLFQNF